MDSLQLEYAWRYLGSPFGGTDKLWSYTWYLEEADWISRAEEGKIVLKHKLNLFHIIEQISSSSYNSTPFPK